MIGLFVTVRPWMWWVSLSVMMLPLGACRPSGQRQAAPSSGAADVSGSRPDATSSPHSATAPQATNVPGAESTAVSRDSHVSDQPQQQFQPVQLASWKEIQQFVGQQKGRVVVVDLWSTTCQSCMRELPHLLELQAAFPDQVACVTVSLDYYGDPSEPPEQFRSKVDAFLRKIGAQVKNFLCTDSDTNVLAALKLSSIPVVLVYDAQGQLVKAFHNDDNEYGSDGFSYQQHIIPFVKSLLGEPGTAKP